MKNFDNEDWLIPGLKNKIFCKQIQDFVIDKITTGQLSKGMKVPSLRELARLNQLNKNTVGMAYNSLIIRGWLTSKSGLGTFVAPRLPISVLSHRPFGFTDKFPTDLESSSKILQQPKGYIQQPFIRVGADFPNPAFFPQDIYNKYSISHMAAAQHVNQAQLFSSYEGNYLKQIVFNYLNHIRNFGLKPGMLEIIKERKTCLDRIFKVLLSKHAEVVINTSPYDVVLNKVLHHRKAIVQYIDSSSVDFLEETEVMLKSAKVRAIYINPQCSFPEGNSFNEMNCKGLIQLAKDYQVCIVEEEDDHEFYYGKVPFTPMACYDHGGFLIYLGTLSKASPYSHSLRVIVASSQFIGRLNDLPAQSISNRDVVQEKTLADMIHNGDLADYMKQLRLSARKNRDQLDWVLSNHLGKYISYAIPEHGQTFWLKFPEHIDLNVVLKKLEAMGISVPYHPNNQKQTARVHYMLLGFGVFDIKEAENAAKLLAEVIHDLL